MIPSPVKIPDGLKQFFRSLVSAILCISYFSLDFRQNVIHHSQHEVLHENQKFNKPIFYTLLSLNQSCAASHIADGGARHALHLFALRVSPQLSLRLQTTHLQCCQEKPDGMPTTDCVFSPFQI